ncbi:hypothetical protein PTB13_08090, partial [Bacillus sp. MHSD17]|nr:hypothetical protein [Bacillus sp. MHSD17]
MTKENPSNYKTLQIWIKKGHRMYSYFQECCHNAKNMYNTTNLSRIVAMSFCEPRSCCVHLSS